AHAPTPSTAPFLYPTLVSSSPPRPPSRTRCPYTTLFRSGAVMAGADPQRIGQALTLLEHAVIGAIEEVLQRAAHIAEVLGGAERSEEHTSELQSRENLVCRLLLEKKKNGASRSEEHTTGL